MARLAEPTAATETTLAAVADPHVGVRSEGTSKLFGRTEQHFRNAVDDIRERDIDVVCSAGDLTKDGEPYNYDVVNRILDDLDVPFYAVPGNHDVPKSRDEHNTMPVAEFASRYAPGSSYPFSASVGDVDIVGFNTAGTADWLFESHDGQFDPAKSDAIRETLAAADDPVVLSHYNLPAMFDQLRAHRDAVEPEMGIPPITRRGEAYAETLAEGDTSLLLTGHLHMPATATQAGVREVMVPTTCSFPQAYLTVTVGADGTTVRFHPVAGRDGMRHAFDERSTNSATSRGLTAMAADRLARFPLVDERP
ncbi:metallophosphoesterase [Halobacteriales archaeon QH_8_67_27]|nr:MAG: metallophosphoesterase [Halobacteriales archaeon QH_8_67_27]